MTTTTPDNPAEVAITGNDGTYEVAFTIPQGTTGPAGPAPVITAGAVTATGPDSPPEVDITGTDGTYEVAFTIPQGATGPTGPAGGGLAAYGGLYQNATQTVATTTAATPVQVALANDMTNVGVTGAANALTVPEDGNYEVTYRLDVAPVTTDATIEVYARTDGTTEIAATNTSKDLTTTTGGTFTGTTILPLTAGQTVDLAAESSGTDAISVSNAFLTVRKLSPVSETP